MKFQPGQRVQKVGGDYQLTGTVVAAFAKLSGQVRYVVEADVPKGLLHIYSDSNLALLEDENVVGTESGNTSAPS